MNRLAVLLPLSAIACNTHSEEEATAPQLFDTEAYMEQEVLVRIDAGDYEVAVEHYRRYLELVPGRERDQEVVRGIIQEIGG